MKKLLNTLYVSTPGSYLARDGETVLVRLEQETRLRVPVHTLDGIVCFGQVSMSPPLMGLCADRNVTVSFLTDYGRFLARVQGPASGNVLLRREQYRRADDAEASAEIARSAVIAKIANSRLVLQRAARDRPDHPQQEALKLAADQLKNIGSDLDRPLPLEIVRGREGEAARVYFGVFDHLITAQKEDFFFRERNRRPPLDNMNALLSFIYTLLAHDMASGLEAAGLDPAVGYLHRDRPGRPSLALDLMEELRPVLADRLALTLVNRQQVKGAGFTRTESGAVTMDDATRKELLVAWQKRKQEEIQHPFLNEKIPVGLLPFAQAMLLARHLRGDLDGYPPYLWRQEAAVMMVVVAYDVNTETPEGRKRLRRVANACKDWGLRVQFSVFECLVDPAQWTKLRRRLVGEIDEDQDSLRFYFLGAKYQHRIEQVGLKKSYDPEGPLIV